MRKSRFSEEQIIGVLKEHRAGVPVAELCRKHGISDATFYNWRSRYGGMEASDAKRLKALEEENHELKKLFGVEACFTPCRIGWSRCANTMTAHTPSSTDLAASAATTAPACWKRKRKARLTCRLRDRLSVPGHAQEQTGNKRPTDALPKPDNLISYRHVRVWSGL